MITGFTITCLIVNILLTFLMWKNILTQYIQYFIIVGLSVLAWLLISTSNSFYSYLILFANLVLIALYTNYWPTLIMGISNLIIVNSLLGGIGRNNLLIIDLYLVLITVLVLTQTHLRIKIQRRIDEKHQQVIKTEKEKESLLEEIMTTVKELSNFNSSLKENIKVTDRISSEVTKAFTDIAKGIEDQAHSVNEINESARSSNHNVRALASASNEMLNLSNKTVNATSKGNEQVDLLDTKMQDVDQIINESVDLINRLNEQAQQIGDIVETINNIAKQTNLLALNAAIEAARAGGSRSGFCCGGRRNT